MNRHWWITEAEMVRELRASEVRRGDHAADIFILIIAVVVFGGWLIGWALGMLA